MTQELKRLPIKEIRERVARADIAEAKRLLRALQRDERQGVRALGAALGARLLAARRERRRVARMLRHERTLWRGGAEYVAGVDEVGVGPLAGPVVAAAVILDPTTHLVGVNDSKKLDADTRTALASAIRQCAVGFGIGVATVAEIDRLNIYHAGLLAMRRAVEALPVIPNHVLVDARTIPDLAIPQRNFIKGDGLCYSIAAASIVAKTYRDQLMTNLDRQYPEYGFRRHKGYGTPEHQAALRRYGPCPLHRQSYVFLQELCGHCSPAFYAIRRQLAAAHGLSALRTVTRRIERANGALSASERRKLRLLVTRQRNAWAQS